VLGKSIVPLGKSIVRRSLRRGCVSEQRETRAECQDALGKSIVPSGRSIVRVRESRETLSVFREVLGKSIVPLSLRVDALGK
jgi:hypothetical protein